MSTARAFPRSVRILVGLAVCAPIAAPVQAADSAVKTASRLITNEQQTIGRLVHPTAKLVAVTVDRSEATRSGHRLECAFEFKSATGKPFQTKLAFFFDMNGKFVDQIETVSTTSRNPLGKPWQGATRALGALGSKLVADPQSAKGRALAVALKSADAKRVCELYLLSR